MATPHRRRPSRTVRPTGGLTAVAAIAGGAFALGGSASAASVGAVYSRTGDATRLVDFAGTKGPAWLSMRSATRDQHCPGGARNYADASGSPVTQSAGAHAKAFAASTG